MAKQKATGTKEKPAQPKGPYLSIAAICENVLEDKDSVLSLVRIVDKFVLRVQGIGMQPPATMSGMVAPIGFQIVVIFKEGKFRGRRHLKLIPKSPSGVVLAQSTIPLTFKGIPGQGVVVRAPTSLGVSEEGLHWIDVFLDEELVTRMPLTIEYQRMETGIANPQPAQ